MGTIFCDVLRQFAQHAAAVIDIDLDRVGEIEGKLQAEAADNPLGFSGGVERLLSNLKRTTASQVWNIGPDPWTANPPYDSPDIGAVIQEVVNRPGWAPGNALVLIYTMSNYTQNRRIWAYDGDPTRAAKLKITYQPK